MMPRLTVCSTIAFLLASVVPPGLLAQEVEPEIAVPAVHQNIHLNEDGTLQVTVRNRALTDRSAPSELTLERLRGTPQGTEYGIRFSFGAGLNGVLHAGLVPYDDSRHPQPVWRRVHRIFDGNAEVDILHEFADRYDMIGWQTSGRGVLGYRVIDENGYMLHDGRIGFRGTGPFEIDDTIVWGPSVHLLGHDGATIAFETNRPVEASVHVDDVEYESPNRATHHEIAVSGLEADSLYDYEVEAGDVRQAFSFRTAPVPGSRRPFTFAYVSDSRSGAGGGERDLFGTNFYMVKRILALSTMRDAAFVQFTGDLVNGYLSDPAEIELQYANFKRAVEPFTHYIPVLPGMGNHETVNREFIDATGTASISVDRFPYETESSEAIFAREFINPLNGPMSEDGAYYDPNPDGIDFPTYKENVYYFTYGNVAMVVLNSDYWFTPSTGAIPFVGGGLHGYVMDVQLAWLADTIERLEDDDHIDHVFVTIHTPFFPNGGHVGDDMWYDGNNQQRPFVAGRPLVKGIIERRDELLDILVNNSRKVVALLTGDEHNYARTEVGPETPMYPEPYFSPKLILNRTVHQINNGAAGAPYYAQEQTPWTDFVSGFTTQFALVLFHVNGGHVEMEVLNPDTLEPVDSLTLR